MTEVFEEGQFLGLPQTDGQPDVVVVPLAYDCLLYTSDAADD